MRQLQQSQSQFRHFGFNPMMLGGGYSGNWQSQRRKLKKIKRKIKKEKKKRERERERKEAFGKDSK